MKIQKKQEIEFFGTKTGNANSIALGYATETKNFGEVAVGVMNKSTAAKDPNSSKGVCVDPDATLFSVGCGGSGERKNALEVKGDGSVIIPGENGNINIADKIKQAFDTDTSIELVKSAENSLQYTLMVNNESRGSINIPKDQFLKNVTYDSEGKQLVFTFVTIDEDEHVEKVPVGDLKDIYTAGEGINIDNNVISADFSSVMTAISDEKTQRETADNEIKSTLDTKADKTSIPTKFSNLQNDSVTIETIKGDTKSKFNLIHKESDILRSELSYNTVNKDTAIAEFRLRSFDATGSHLSQIRMRPENNKDDGQYIIQIQDVVGKKINHITTIGTQNIQNVDYENNTGTMVGSGGIEFYDLTNAAQPISVITKDGMRKTDGKQTEVYTTNGSTFDLTTKADASELKDVKKQVENKADLVDGKVPLAQLGNIDTQVMLVVDKLPNTDIKANKIYLVKNTDSTEDQNVYTEYVYVNWKWEKVGEFKPEVDMSEYVKSNEIYQCIKKEYDSSKRGDNSIAIDDTAVASGKFSVAIGNSANATKSYTTTLGYKTKATGLESTAIGAYAEATGLDSTALGRYTKANGNAAIAIGSYSKATNDAAAIGKEANATGFRSIALSGNATGESSIAIAGQATGDGSIAIGGQANGFASIALGFAAITSTVSKYALGGWDENKQDLFNIEEITCSQYGNKKYLIGLGGYDGTNITIDNEAGEKVLNPNIKSVQQIINEKADASAIPTKVSQLTNDANFITSYTETDPIWTREKTNYYTKTEIDNKGYLTQHQPLDNYVTKSTADANYLSLANGGDIKNEVTISKTNAASNDYTLHLANEALYIGRNDEFSSVVSINPRNFVYSDFIFYIDENQFSFNNCFAVRKNDENNGGKNTIQLGKVLITESSLSRLNLVLDNITAASTAEEVVTKFNALLADLKNKGLMEADVTA